MPDARLTIHPGDVLAGKYVIERVLGRGGMGLVVAGRHVDLGEVFAIKLMLPNAIQRGDAIERFLREARAAAKLKGEHVARVHDVGRLEGGTPYMVMEYLTGEDLGSVMRRRGTLPLEEAASYIIQACEALEEAHHAGIVHRDLTPGNLFLAQRPNGTVCLKVLDFGISKHLESDITKTGEVYGTAGYMAPEQMRGLRDVDAQADVWSLGTVFYQLLTGALPFPGQSGLEIVSRVLETEPPAPSRVRPELPVEIDRLILGCLAKERNKRVGSVAEIAAELRALHLAEPSPPTLARSSIIPPASARTSVMPRAPAAAELPTGVQTWSVTGRMLRSAASKRWRIALIVGLSASAAIVVGLIVTSSSAPPGSPAPAATSPPIELPREPIEPLKMPVEPLKVALEPPNEPEAIPSEAASSSAVPPVQSAAPSSKSKLPKPPALSPTQPRGSSPPRPIF